jgi:hypothetical protein
MIALRVVPPVLVALMGLTLEAPERATESAGQDPDPAAGPSEGPHAAWEARILDDGRPRMLEDLSGLTCAGCHLEVTEEWRRTTHALAWVDPHYQAELRKIRRKKGCTGCHAPAPLAGSQAKGSPPTREEDPHLGVTCTTCHLGADGETILGPAGHPTEAHPSARHEFFDPDAGSALCVSCHDVTIGPVIGVAKDWLRSGEADGGDSCVDCHMPKIRRPWANDPETGQPLEVRRGRSHLIEGPRDPDFLRQALYLEAEFEEAGPILRVQNLTGHRVPGLVDRELTLEVRAFDEAGQELARTERTFDHRSYLPLDREVEVPLEAPRAARIEVRGRHRAPGIPKGVWFLERSFARPGQSTPD